MCSFHTQINIMQKLFVDACFLFLLCEPSSVKLFHTHTHSNNSKDFFFLSSKAPPAVNKGIYSRLPVSLGYKVLYGILHNSKTLWHLYKNSAENSRIIRSSFLYLLLMLFAIIGGGQSISGVLQLNCFNHFKHAGL